jgi:tetratricopeptide (TPR) repeat protein
MGPCSKLIAVALLLVVVILAGTRVTAGDDALREVIDLFDRQEYDEARRALEGLPEGDTEAAQALYYLGRLDLIAGDRKGAEKHFEQAIKTDPEQSDYHHWLAIAIMQGMPYRSFLGKMTGSMKMLKEFKKAVELDPANLRPRMTLFQIMVRSFGRGMGSRGDLVEQIEAIAGIDSVMGYVARGTLFQIVDEDMEKAGALFEQAYHLEPTNRAAAISYADFLWEAGDRDRVIQVLTAFVESGPDDRSAHFNLAVRTILEGTDYARARSLLEECLDLKSDNGMPPEAMVRWCLGLACHLLGEEDEAQAQWKLAHDLNPDFDKLLEADPMLSELNSLPGEKQ